MLLAVFIVVLYSIPLMVSRPSGCALTYGDSFDIPLWGK
jgi:hypothetical protein